MPRVRAACELLACFAFLLYLTRLSFKSRDDIMCSATALPTDSSFQGMEDRLRERLKEVKRNSLGSEYVAFHAGRDEVIALAESDLVNAFRRVVLDPVRVLVMLMSPSGGHEITSRDLERFISSVASLFMKQSATCFRGMHWRFARKRRSTSLQADSPNQAKPCLDLLIASSMS